VTMSTEEANDIQNSPVTAPQVTSESSKQTPSSATEAAEWELEEERSQGRDYISGKLPTKVADSIAKRIKEKYNIETKKQTVYKAQGQLKEKQRETIAKTVNDNIAGEIVKDPTEDLLSGAQPIKKVEDADTKDAGQQQQQQTGQTPPAGATEQPTKEKTFEPINGKDLQTITDVLIEAAASACEHFGKKIPDKNIEACKVTLTTTLNAYNGSIPKQALIPITIATFGATFAPPLAGEIKKLFNRGKKQGDETPAADASPSS
jgi:hypothetical protein